MGDQTPQDLSQAFEKALQEAETSHYLLRLYIAGNTERSAAAILNLRQMCDEYLPGRYELEVVDIRQQPALAKNDDIIATPTLVKFLPLPIRRIIGDISQVDRILIGLNLVKPK